MKLFEQIQGTVEKLDPQGHGLLGKNSQEVASFFTVPGDEVKLTLTKRRRGRLHGRLEQIICPSPARVNPPCPYAGRCGGCLWQMIDYPKQLEYKRDLVNQTFQNQQLNLTIKSVEPSKEIFYHRNRMDYVFGSNGQLGLKEPEQWWSVLNLETCLLLSKETPEILRQARQWMRQWNLAPWDAKTYQGFLRYLVIREGKATGERMITLVTGAGQLPADAKQDLIARLKDFTTTLYWGINPLPADLSSSSQLTLLSGKSHLEEKVNGFRFRLHPNSFFQTNGLMAGRLMEIVRDSAHVSAAHRLLDLYCGLGFFAIGIGKAAAEVLGVEIDQAAVELARENAALNDVPRAVFLAGPVEKLLPKLPRPDIVIVDPPRSGLHPKAQKTLLSLLPQRLVYVSCNYQSLARELPEFLKYYTVEELLALDLFPHTPHLELIVRLERLN
ncbi:23S rRNA (uracil(1939)-C(5))-methyltransferase RlmD [Candidatus Uhrbacteria bacterium]|nr:23S rRNA (uracil(1939)-C(5))-methyltransferase RlmD [Candidatus Uhrbacteria bacterium]